MMRQDLRYAVRTLASSPGFAVVSIISLAFGIGANVAIFSLLNSVLLRPLPVRDPQGLVILTSPGRRGAVSVGYQAGVRSGLTYAEFRQLQDQSPVFSELMASQRTLNNVQARVDGDEAEEISTQLVSAEYFTTLGVRAAMGRVFPAQARTEGAAPYAVISHSYWQRRFGGRDNVLGATVAIQGGVFSIIGVAPASFFGETVGRRPDVWLPVSMAATVLPGRDWLRDRPGDLDKVMFLNAFGRLKPGVTLDEAQANANVVFRQGLAAHYGSVLTPEDQRKFMDQQLELQSAATGASRIRTQFAEPLLILLVAAGVVLLISCANLGNLLLARATTRTREVAMRLALGASRGRVIRQLLTETMLLAAIGGIAGLGAAFFLRVGLLRLVSPSIELPGTPDVRVLGFAFALTLAVGAMLGLLPAVRTTKTEVAGGLREQGRGFAGSALWRRVGQLVVITQLALSLPLLVTAGLLLQTLSNLQQVELGYPKERLLVVHVDAQTAGYGEERRVALFQQVLERIRAVPGIAAASYSKNGLFSGSDSDGEIVVEGYTSSGSRNPEVPWDHVGPNYFSTLGIPVLVGREITDRDQPSSQQVCVINEAFAKKFFAGRDPIGLHLTQVNGNQRKMYQIVGVARDSRAHTLRRDVEDRFYVPAAQPVNMPRSVSFLIRTATEPSNALADVRRAVVQVDPMLPVTTARTLAELVDEHVTQDRLLARLSTAFGLVGLLLAAVGLYGVLSYGVAQRTKEIGIRKALGAQHSTVITMILRETGWPVAVGLAAGMACSIMTVQLIASRLYGLAPADPLAFAAGIAVLCGVALIATCLPAYRASRVDPLVALRNE